MVWDIIVIIQYIFCRGTDIMNKKLKFISYAYAIGAILVVLGHSTPTGVSDMPLIVDKIRTFVLYLILYHINYDKRMPVL